MFSKREPSPDKAAEKGVDKSDGEEKKKFNFLKLKTKPKSEPPSPVKVTHAEQQKPR